MKIIVEPRVEDYESLSKRPELDLISLENSVMEVFNAVKQNGDEALKAYTKKFDSVEIANLLVSKAEIEEANTLVNDELKQAIEVAKNNIKKFHTAQKENVLVVETMPGVTCWRKSVGIEKVGIYIPGGTAPLFSTVLMLAIPA
ncbi:MAG: histidinol dehydrogenase, partial [Bacteroidia bacterium]